MIVKFNYFSDLHLDNDSFPLHELYGGDILLIAGDTCSWSRVKEGGMSRIWTKVVRSFFEEASKLWNIILIIPGNHCFWDYQYDKVPDLMREILAPYPNVIVLNNESYEYKGIKFIGSCLWTDFNNANPNSMDEIRWEIMMPDKRHIHMNTEHGDSLITSQFILEKHYESVEKIKELIGTDDKPCVVFTHHGPTFKSSDPKYNHHGDEYYFSNLSDLILDYPQIKAWVHGHTHTPCEYDVGVHCRVLVNPRGYRLENLVFNPRAYFMVENDPKAMVPWV